MGALLPRAGMLATPLATPSIAERHPLSRFSFGCTPELVREAAAAGGVHGWFEQQLAPAGVPDAFATDLRSWWPRLSLTPAELQAGKNAGTLVPFDVMMDLVRWTLMRRTYSKRQLHEVMVAFFLDHLHITAPADGSWAVRIEHDTIVRQHALGRYEDMLLAVELGRPMVSHLDNAVSTAKRLNENLGREMLELHTVGRDIDYPESAVLNAARVLTGYKVDRHKTWAASYSAADHWMGPISVVGFTAANDAPDGRQVARDLVVHLARHPATAHRLALKLCRRFVSDTPSSAVVEAVAQAYLTSGSDIPSMLRALISHPDFETAVGAKTRTPSEDCIASWRVLEVKVAKPVTASDFANQSVIQAVTAGQRPFEWPRPDGPPDAADAWSSVSRLLACWNIHYGLAAGYSPKTGITYRTTASWLPDSLLPTTVAALIDHVCRQLLCRPADDRLTAAVAQRINLAASTPLRSMDDLKSWRVPRLVAAVLDTPEHMSR